MPSTNRLRIPLALCCTLSAVSSSPCATNAEDKAIAVRTAVVQAAETQRSTSQPASIEAYYTARIQSRLSGYVKEVKVEIGDPVKSGDVLASLSVPELDKQLLVAESQIKRLEAEELKAKAEVELAASELKAAEATLEQVTAESEAFAAQMAADEAEFQRVSDLVQRGSIQPRLLDEVKSKRDASRARQAAAQSSIVSSQAMVVVARSRHSAAKANVGVTNAKTNVAKAQLTELEAMAAFATIKAPFNGVVTYRSVNPGDLVSESLQTAMFEVSQMDKLRCRIAVPEREAAIISRGDAVKLTLPSFDTEVIEASVSRTSQSLNRETRTMLVEADIDNKDGRLLPGMFGSASIQSSVAGKIGLLPARAVRFDEQGNPFVYLIGEDSTVSVTDITIGQDDGTHLQIISGLVAGQTVVDAHLKRFTDGQLVRVVDQ